jgi:hypothetical protein
MRGPQGSGKSTLLRRTGLNWHAVSPDDIRKTYAGMRLASHGGWIDHQDDNPAIWTLAFESFRRRIADGETIAFDATLPTAAEVEAIAFEARDAGYEVLVVDRYGCDRELAFSHNQSRHPIQRVPRASFDKFCKLADTTRALDPSLTVLSTGDDLDASEAGIIAFLERGMAPVDLSQYERVIHVGDLQGCLSPLVDQTSPVAQWLDDPATFTIFVGDLLDRGNENGEVIKWWLANVHGRKNAMLIAGNHEDHIERAAAGLPPVSREFERRTMPQLDAAGVTKEDLTAIAASAKTHLAYTWRGKGVLVTHAGLAQWPEPFWSVPAKQLRKGPGRYQTPIDDAWSRWSLSDQGSAFAMRLGVEEVWQVHGHRNNASLPIMAAQRSINLEGQVEFGGFMRFAVLSEAGWKPVAVRNRVHRTMQEFKMQDQADGRTSYVGVPIAPWAADGSSEQRVISPERLEAIRSDAMVHERVSDSRPYISAFNFSKSAFYGKHWNEMTTHTRGLFIDTTERRIVARSYPKFFNRGEREDTRDDALEANLVFPVCAYVKENGFLGITGYDESSGELVIASKSVMEGDFAAWFREILTDTLGEVGMERLLRFNRDQVASCTFEVVDPVNDPHIITESKRRVVLLDAIHRDEEFAYMPYADLVKLGEHLGCEVKKTAFRNIPNWRALQNILDKIENDVDWRPYRGSGPVEGVVVEDAAGFMLKIKAPFYVAWKRARYGKERIALSRRNAAKAIDMARYSDDPMLADFMRWADQQTDAVLEWDIVRLRDAYLADPNSLIDGGQPPVVETAPDQSGFLRGLDAIAAQIDASTAKPESVLRMVMRANADPHQSAALAAHPAYGRIVEVAKAHENAIAMQRADDAQARLEAIGVKLDTYGGNCPVQIEGTYQGEPFYFRARGSHWAVYIGEGALTVDPQALYARDTYRPEGTSDEDARFVAGWMPLDEAFDILRLTLERWRSETKGGVTG